MNGRPHSTQLNVRSWKFGTGILSFPELVRHAHWWLPRVSDYNAKTPCEGSNASMGAAGPQVGIARSVHCARETDDPGRIVTVVDYPPRLQAALPRVAQCYVRYPICREMPSGTRSGCRSQSMAPPWVRTGAPFHRRASISRRPRARSASPLFRRPVVRRGVGRTRGSHRHTGSDRDSRGTFPS